jgi:hypothetical protein
MSARTSFLASSDLEWRMKVTIPEELKADVPQTTFGKILSATPVVMAVVATMLAGLSSSEMTRAQYSRSLAAQQQSKAGDQWGYFQAKRMRGALQRSTLDMLQSTTELTAFDPATLKAIPEVASLLGGPAGPQTLELLLRGEAPAPGQAPALSPEIRAALQAVEAGKTDSELLPFIAALDPKGLEQAVRAAREYSQSFDDQTKPINQLVDQVESRLVKQAVAGLTRTFTAARLRYAAARYEVEARLNQVLANLIELQVRKSNLIAERHHQRSERFFLGMLAAQAGVIISTFAVAARKRNLLWSLAAGAGVIAVAFAVYVYLYV